MFSLLASLFVALFFVPMLAASEISLPKIRPELRAIARSTSFLSIGQLREAWSTQTGRARWVRAPYWLGRFLIRLAFELVGTITIVLTAVLWRPSALIAGRVGPWLMSHALQGATRFQKRYLVLENRYHGVIDKVLNQPRHVLGLAAATVVLSIPVGGMLGQSLIPELHQGRFTAELALPVGTPLHQTIDRIREVETAVLDHPDVAHVHTIVGTERRADSRPDEGEHTARIMVELTKGGNLVDRETRLMNRLRVRVQEMTEPRPEIRMRRPSLFTFRTPVEVVVFDRDLARLTDNAEMVRRRLNRLSSLSDVRSSMASGYPEVRIQYDRTLLDRFNLNTATVAQRVRDKILGTTATTLSRDDGRVNLTVRLDPSDRRGVAALERINVNPELNPPIPLNAVATFTQAVGPSEIRRVDQRRAVAVTANMSGFDLSSVATDIEQALDEIDLQSDWILAGQNREMQRSLGSMQLALGLAIFLVYVIMASTFESILHPFVILLSVPLALVGVVGVLGLTGTSVSVVVLIGAIVLCGVVVNNAIVLVDTINRHRTQGVERILAIKQGAILRLRPILITTMTTVLGLLPLALGIGEGAEIQRPLALTVIAGLLSATLLTLVVIPVVYRVMTNLFESKGQAA